MFPLPLAAALLLAAPEPAPAPHPEPTPAQRMIAGYFRHQVKQIADVCLADVTTRAAWEKRRPELHRQFLDMMGLWPLPPRTDLKPTVTGTAKGDGFTVENVAFQSRPGLYVTANFYLPADFKGKKLPTVLYVCGHANVVQNGVSFGSKAHYQYHPAWFARNGYACLILDTLQLHEIPGTHHGTHHLGMWWWHARGYTPAGVELWNAMRAIDYLETRPEVDKDRIGVTGRSGGGATSWWIAAADERIKAAVPVAGIADLEAHLCEAPLIRGGVISGHCDCMYFSNTHRWDFPMVAALVAPRPLLLGNSDNDGIFPVDGYRRIAAKVRPVYALYGADEKFQLLETKGPHQDTPALRVGINRWMNRWLKGDTKAASADDLPAKLPPQQLKVLAKVPEGELNSTLHEVFVKPAVVELPQAAGVVKEWWPRRREELLAELKDRTFGGWAKTPPPLGAKDAADVTADGVRLRAWDFTSEAGIELRLFLLTAGKPDKVVLSVLDDAGWEKWCRDLGPAFAGALQVNGTLKRDDAQFAQNKAAMAAEKVAFAAVAPRGVGPTKWAERGTPAETHIRRRFALIGQTLDGQRAWDVRRAVQALAAMPELKAKPIALHGEREAAGVALMAGLFEPAVGSFDLWHLPPTYRDGPTFLNLARVLDVPQAVALAGPRPVALRVKADDDRAAWDWPLRLQAATGGTWLTVTAVGE